MKKRLVLLGATLGFVLGFQDIALAWGPGVHIATGNFLLENLQLILPNIANTISAFHQHFLYGCLSADMYVGKGKTLTDTHCHNWRTGFRLLEGNQDPALQSYAYGYLAHLAADTVAHNYYVPNMLQCTPGAGKLNHVYIEMQADQKEGGKLPLNLVNQGIHHRADARLVRVLEKPQLSFQLKKKLFQSGVAVSRLKSWRVSLEMMDKALPMAQGETYLREMLQLTVAVILDLLNDPNQATALDYDPMGYTSLDQAKRYRRVAGRVTSNPLHQTERFFLPDRKLTTLQTLRN